MIPKLSKLNPVQSHYLEFLQQLKKSKFQGDICPDYANRTVLATDNSIYQVLPQGVIYPKNTDDLITLCELLHQPKYRDIVVSPRGGGTGTNGQSLTDGIVVDISKHMNSIIEINAEEGWVRTQTGVVKDQLNAALKAHGLFFAPDLSTSNRATLGGMINTDASGQGSCLYGKTRDHVLALQTVLLDGSVVHSKALNDEQLECECEPQTRSGLIHRLANSIEHEYRDKIDEIFPPLNRCMTGYDLAHIRDAENNFNLNNILCGSEGTLGFITEAKLNVIPIPKCFALVVVKYNNFDSSLRDATELMTHSPTSVETIDSKVLALAMNDFIWTEVEAFFQEETREPVQGVNFVEFTAENQDELDQTIRQFSQYLSRSIESADTARVGFSVVNGKPNVDKIWAMRKRAVGLLGNAKGEARPVPFVEDTAVPPEHLADFILEFREILDAYDLSYGMFGHVDAGVLHVRPALDMKLAEDESKAWEISDRIADLTHQYGGVMWGEHGKGVRSEYAPKFFGELYPQLQRIKASFDPYNQLNPGKIATPSEALNLLKIDEVTTRGQRDKTIAKESWQQFSDAVYCNGNGACYNWNHNDPMCPSWKVTRQRTHSPKGRASLVREWIKQISEQPNAQPVNHYYKQNSLIHIVNWPKKVVNHFKKKDEYDFSNEVYDSMAGCLACKSCTGQCPIKVDVPEFRSRFLAAYHTRYIRPLKDYLVGSLEFLLPWCAKISPLYNAVMSLPPVTYFLDKVIGFVDGPMLSKQTLPKEQYRIATAKDLKNLTDEEKSNTVVIVQDAFTRYFETQLVIDTYTLIEKLGFTPYIAPYKPNGKPLHVHGFLKQFAKTARQQATLLNEYNDNGIALIGIDPSMTLTYRGEYTKYLENIPAPNVQLIQEWLDTYLTQEQLNNIQVKNTNKEFTLLPHCTEKSNAAGSLAQWKNIFAKLGLTLNVQNLGCCGMSGTYGHESRNKENSQALYKMSWEKVVSNAEDSSTLLATGYSCRSQVKREGNTQLQHPLQAMLKSIS